MDRFQALQVFVQVADMGGFAAAARKLNMSPPAVTRAVSALEDRIGTRLFVRTTRSVRLTESGERFLDDSRRILMELEEAEEAAIGSHAAPRGDLNITAPVLYGRMYVAPLIGDFLHMYPLVNAQTMFVDRVVNMMDEGMDIAVRIGRLPDSSLSAIRVGTVRRVTFGSTAYLKQHGIPQHPNDLKDHRIIQATAISSIREWTFTKQDQRVSVPIHPRLRMNTNDAVIEMTKRGCGIARLLSYQIAPYLADNSVKAVLSEFEDDPLPVHILHQEGRLVSAKVRSCVDYLVDHLREDKHLN